jgi:hypothetical protein
VAAAVDRVALGLSLEAVPLAAFMASPFALGPAVWAAVQPLLVAPPESSFKGDASAGGAAKKVFEYYQASHGRRSRFLAGRSVSFDPYGVDRPAGT